MRHRPPGRLANARSGPTARLSLPRITREPRRARMDALACRCCGDPALSPLARAVRTAQAIENSQYYPARLRHLTDRLLAGLPPDKTSAERLNSAAHAFLWMLSQAVVELVCSNGLPSRQQVFGVVRLDLCAPACCAGAFCRKIPPVIGFRLHIPNRLAAEVEIMQLSEAENSGPRASSAVARDEMHVISPIHSSRNSRNPGCAFQSGAPGGNSVTLSFSDG